MRAMPFVALAAVACSGVDEHIPPRVLDDAAVVDADPRDAPIDAWVDAPNDGVIPLPDITLVERLISDTIRVQDLNFDANACELVEGCIGAPGSRRLLRFSTVTANQGEGDLYVGSPEGNPHYTYSDCHGHYHFNGYADYELLDGDGVVVTGNKQAFCLLDSIRMDPMAPPAKFSCELQGISAGWADSYPFYLPCQWIDITDVTPGLYTLRITVNPSQILAESDYTNNVLELPVTF